MNRGLYRTLGPEQFWPSHLGVPANLPESGQFVSDATHEGRTKLVGAQGPTIYMSDYDDLTTQDSTQAFRNAVVAADQLAQQTTGKCVILLNSRPHYILAQGPIIANRQNAIVPLPARTSGFATWIELQGMRGGGPSTLIQGTPLQYPWPSGVPQTAGPTPTGGGGTVIEVPYSFASTAGVSYSTATGLASVFGTFSSYNVNNTYTGANNAKSIVGFAMRDVTMLQPTVPCYCAIDTGWCQVVDYDRVAIMTQQFVNGTAQGQLGATWGTMATGIVLPFLDCDWSHIGQLTINGMANGLNIGEQLQADYVNIEFCNVACIVDTAYYSNRFNTLIEGNNVVSFAAYDPSTGIASAPTNNAPNGSGANISGSGGFSGVSMGEWRIQDNNNVVPGLNRAYHIIDTNNVLYLNALFNRVLANSGETTGLIISGDGAQAGATCKHVNAIDMQQTLGPVTAPTLSTSGNRIRNTFCRPALATVTAGAFTSFSINGGGTGFATGPWMIPANAYFTPSWASAPTWKWETI